MNYECNALPLAQYTVTKCEAEGEPISNLQLQKIMYFLQSVYCRSTHGNLLFPDEFYAWPYGPVLPNVYEKFSNYGGRLIHDKFDQPLLMSTGTKTFIDEGIEILRKKSPWDLVRTSHAPNSPWDQIWRGGIGFKEKIPNKLIIDAATTGLK